MRCPYVAPGMLALASGRSHQAAQHLGTHSTRRHMHSTPEYNTMVHGVCAFAVPLLYLFAPSMYHRCAPDTGQIVPAVPLCTPLLGYRWGTTQSQMGYNSVQPRGSCKLWPACTCGVPLQGGVPHRHTGSTLMSQGDGHSCNTALCRALKPAETNTNVRAGRRDHGFLSKVQLCVVCVGRRWQCRAVGATSTESGTCLTGVHSTLPLHTAPKIPFTCAA